MKNHLNITNPDRLQRLMIGASLLALNFYRTDLTMADWSSYATMGLQIQLLATGLIGWCPFYWSLSVKKRRA